MEWIAVDEMMPLEMAEVLTFDDIRGIDISYFFNETNCFITTSDGVRLYNARFWMPLPKSPENPN
jgi:hypothetical protein